MQIVKDTLVTLAFLTRLAPARTVGDDEFADSLYTFPLAGLVIGLAAALPFFLGLFADQPWVAAWLFLCLNIYITRGLHCDAVSDVSDAWGSSARGDRFWEIMKDSRIGAFGVIGLFLALAGQLVLYHAAFAAGALGVLVYSLVLGRFCSNVLAYAGRRLARPYGLGRLFVLGVTPECLALSALQLAVFGLWLVPAPVFFLSLPIAALGLFGLYRVARRQGGLNGDFLGTGIIWAELSALIAFVA